MPTHPAEATAWKMYTDITETMKLHKINKNINFEKGKSKEIKYITNYPHRAWKKYLRFWNGVTYELTSTVNNFSSLWFADIIVLSQKMLFKG